MLGGVHVALGVTGSIAAVRTVELAHELRRQGASVRAVMSDSARGIIHPWALEFATGHEVVTEITGSVEHVELCGRDGWADALLVAPATANTVGKVAGAVDDTPVTTTATTALGAGTPVVVAPAMHEPMYDHPGVQRAMEQVGEWGVTFVEPRLEEGKAKIATDEAIVAGVARAAGSRPLAGRRVVVTSGATSEPVDPVRILTNRSSGKMGRAVARACYALGAEVTVVHDGPSLPYADVEHVETAAEMREATLAVCERADTLVSAAAIGDFTLEAEPEKIPSGEPRTLSLEPAPKLIDAVAEAYPSLPIVGFKTETGVDEETLLERARAILDRAELTFVVANDASVMGEDSTQALLVHGESVAPYEGTKDGLAREIARSLAAVLE